MKPSHVLNLSLAVCLLGLASGCSSTRVTGRERLVNEQLPRPAHIWVYDFAATPADVPPDSTLARTFTVKAEPQTPQQIADGRALGDKIARELVAEIRKTGLLGEQAMSTSKPGVNDIVIHGYLVSIDEGSAVKRVAIGFGSGSSELRTVVEGFQVTPEGLRKLGGGTVDSGGAKGPGAAVGVATFIATANPAGLIVSSGMKLYGEASGSAKIEGRATATAREVAKVLKQRFKELGWIE